MEPTLVRRCALIALVFFAACAAEVAYRRPEVVYDSQPQLVDVEPGVQVVPEQENEVFYVGGAYWTRRDNRWWHAPDHRGGWVQSEDREVPDRIRAYPAGKYRNYRASADHHPVVPVR